MEFFVTRLMPEMLSMESVGTRYSMGVKYPLEIPFEISLSESISASGCIPVYTITHQWLRLWYILYYLTNTKYAYVYIILYMHFRKY